MKTIINNRLAAILFVTALTLGTAFNANANTDPKPTVPVELKFAGFVKNQPMFQLNFTGNSQQDEFTIHITDEFGTSLYKENIKGEVFNKKFLVNTDEIGDNLLRFEVISRKTNASIVFEVNRNVRTVQDVAINEIK